ncbi:hypothetical protein DYB30_005484 [Aphanomyces astaci]|uniref:Uncharacterized protein n=1 Tax=Aphanomyces astaci TaxID=112090 RepID=A0A397D0M4_APHAT|nr:hypothetical protein DYB34_004752 [Aphanomyces astaci]RHY56700.1 hypothetical protein DYB30_005484 [Aphanomyces astaci]RHZ05697.1 hypothetical protein DYB26_011230 [Aphanomyces astaci]
MAAVDIESQQLLLHTETTIAAFDIPNNGGAADDAETEEAEEDLDDDDDDNSVSHVASATSQQHSNLQRLLDSMDRKTKTELFSDALELCGNDLFTGHEAWQDQLLLKACRLHPAFVSSINELAHQSGSYNTPVVLSGDEDDEDEEDDADDYDDDASFAQDNGDDNGDDNDDDDALNLVEDDEDDELELGDLSDL